MKRTAIVLLIALAISLLLALGISRTGFFIQQLTLPAKLTVKPLYILDLNIEMDSKSTLPNSTLDVLIGLNKTGRGGEIEVELSYKIITPRREEIETTADIYTLTVENYTEASVEVYVPDLRPGRYKLNVTATHPQAVAVSDVEVFFIRKTSKSLWEIILEFFGII